MSTGINIGAIEREMSEVWREEATGEGEERAVTRACVLTLLVYSDADGCGPELDDTLYAVTEAHPARVLVMSIEPGDEPSVSAAVTAACRVQGTRSKQLSCEQVTLSATGEGARQLPSAVAQLLAPDVPVYLWWRSAMPHPDDYVFSHLAGMTDRVIFDSTSCVDVRESFETLDAALSENPEWTAVTDFTWQRLTPWRQMFASFYDVAEHREYLDRADTLTVEYVPDTGKSDIPPRAVLFAAWLAERLGWQLDADASSHDGDHNRFVFDAGGREVVARFVAVDREGLDGLMVRASLEASGTPSASFTVSREARNRLSSETTIDGKRQASRTLSYRPRTEAELLATELGISGHDNAYEAALAISARIGAVKQQ